MTREEFYKTNRQEREYYLETEDVDMFLPVTIDGFEALLEKAAAENELPIDNRLRSLAAGFIHHIASDVVMINFPTLCNALYKSYSNSMTYEVDQKAKAEETEALNRKKGIKDNGIIIPINGA